MFSVLQMPKFYTDISGFYFSKYAVDNLLGYDVMNSVGNVFVIQRNLPLPPSSLQMDETCSSKM
jgi:hypothetical protein